MQGAEQSKKTLDHFKNIRYIYVKEVKNKEKEAVIVQKIIFAHMSSKFLITVPKEARRVLGIEGGSGPIGFIIEPETRTVKLTRINITPADEDFTDEECRKLLKLADKPGGKKLDKITMKSIAGDNPDLPPGFIKDVLKAKSRMKNKKDKILTSREFKNKYLPRVSRRKS